MCAVLELAAPAVAAVSDQADFSHDLRNFCGILVSIRRTFPLGCFRLDIASMTGMALIAPAGIIVIRR